MQKSDGPPRWRRIIDLPHDQRVNTGVGPFMKARGTQLLGSSDDPLHLLRNHGWQRGFERRMMEKLTGLSLVSRDGDGAINVQKTNELRTLYIGDAGLAPIIAIDNIKAYRQVWHDGDGLLWVKYVLDPPEMLVSVSPRDRISLVDAIRIFDVGYSVLEEIVGRGEVRKGDNSRDGITVSLADLNRVFKKVDEIPREEPSG